MTQTPRELICTGKWAHRVTLAWASTPMPKGEKCPVCRKPLEKYDGRRHRAPAGSGGVG